MQTQHWGVINEKSNEKYFTLFYFFIGLVLIIGGIITVKLGATVGGIIVAAVNIQQLIKFGRKFNI